MGSLARLKLRHFRNYRSLEAEFGPGLTVLVGDNGQGKTNLLEAVHYLSLLRSFRTRRAGELREWGAAYFHVEAELASPADPARAHLLSVTYVERRRLRLDGQILQKASRFINQFLCVAFVPEDIELVKGGPAGRRRFFDILLCQTCSGYLGHLMDYTTALRSRNAALRDASRYGRGAISAYDRILASHGACLTRARHEFIGAFAAPFAHACVELLGSRRQAAVRYAPSLAKEAVETADAAATEAALQELLARETDRDIEAGATRHGPHRDDVQLFLGDKAAGTFGSEGQCRLVSLGLRLASAGRLALCEGRGPLVLLVDDVLGELDPGTRERFLGALTGADQVLVACTEVPAELQSSADALYAVADGRLQLVPG